MNKCSYLKIALLEKEERLFILVSQYVNKCSYPKERMFFLFLEIP
jgi:hypothetical protein